LQDLSNELGESGMIANHEQLYGRELIKSQSFYIEKLEAQNQLWQQRFRELKHASRGTILNEDGDPLYALIPLRYLESL